MVPRRPHTGDAPVMSFSLASALFSAWNPEVLATVKHRFQERAEACARVVKAAEAAKIENEGRARSEEAHLAKEDALRREVRAHVRPFQYLHDATGRYLCVHNALDVKQKMSHFAFNQNLPSRKTLPQNPFPLYP